MSSVATRPGTVASRSGTPLRGAGTFQFERAYRGDGGCFAEADEPGPVLLNRHDPVKSVSTGPRPRRPRVLLLHGMANSGNVWDELCGKLSGAAELCAAELPWRRDGVSYWSYHPDPSVWLAQALDELGGADVVVAHSYSATLLLDLLTRGSGGGQLRRYGIRGLVLVSAFYRQHPREFDWEDVGNLTEKFLLTMEEGIRVVAAGRGNPERRRAMARRVCEAIGPYGWTRFFDLYLRTPWMLPQRVDVPTLLVCGGADGIARPVESETLARVMPAGRLHTFAGCGHFPMIERAGDFAGLVGDFLDQFRVRPAISADIGA